MKLKKIMSPKSLQAQINELRRIIKDHHQQHKNLKKKVTNHADRLRALEPYSYAEDREAFVASVLEYLENRKRR